MAIKFKQVDLKGIMELDGRIDFPESKVVVLYGANQQGKTNIINAVRYAFLRDVKGLGRPRKEYDEWMLPTREELVFNKEGKIRILFEHNNVAYLLERRILSGGRREESELYPINKPSQKIDIPNFLKNKLKVSLLDVLFAPEIIGGFRQLYSGNIDKSIGELFKEVTNLRGLATRFIFRFKKMEKAAEVEIGNVKNSYSSFCKEILELCPLISDWKEYKQMLVFKIDKVLKNIETLRKRVVKVITKLEEENLLKDINEIVTKAKDRDRINVLIDKQNEILNKLTNLKDTQFDLIHLKKWVQSISQIKDVESQVKTPPKFREKKLQEEVTKILSYLFDAKKHHAEVLKLAKKEKIKLENLEETIRELSKVASLLKKEFKIGKEITASITKIGEKAYTVIDARLLVKDFSLADISKHPIPKGKSTEKQKYLVFLRSKIARLKRIDKHRKEEQSLFERFRKEFPVFYKFEEAREKGVKKLEEEIKKWSEDLASLSSSFTRKKIRVKKMKGSKDVKSFVENITACVLSAEKDYLMKVNATLKQLGIPQIKELKTRKLQTIQRQISRQLESLPKLRELEKILPEKEQEWQQKIEVYQDYVGIPPLVNEIVPLLEMVLKKCFDEQALKAKIASTYMDIIKIMHERNLIKASTEVEQQLKGVVKYRGKIISHPAGSEKAFFSLAILTAMAYYFQTPVLIDEVANNLDSKNLKAFFELIKEFKDKYAVQYVLSVKETKDFEIDRWEDLRDDIEVYEVQDKHIRLIH